MEGLDNIVVREGINGLFSEGMVRCSSLEVFSSSRDGHRAALPVLPVVPFDASINVSIAEDYKRRTAIDRYGRLIRIFTIV